MTTYVNIIFTLFLLLPGFISLKIRQSTREYKELSTFEFTSISLGFSFLIFISWIFLNYVISSFDCIAYSFLNNLKQLFIGQKLEILFTRFFAVFIITYACAFIFFSLLIYNIHWLGLWNKILRKLGLTRFSSHLTPWEDFQILSRIDWLLVELKDGRTVVGKLGFGSHLPFDKEIVLKRTDISSIEIYDDQKQPVDYGHEIDLTYINYSDINTIHSIKDKSIEVSPQKIREYIILFISFLLSSALILSFFSLIAIKIDGQISYNFYLDVIIFMVTISSVIWNLKSLSKFS